MQGFTPSAVVFLNDRFYRVISHAVGLIAVGDPDGFRIFLPPDENDEGLGSAVRQALAASRPIHPEKLQQLVNSGELNRTGNEEDSLMMQRFGYASKRALYKSMKFFSISVVREAFILADSSQEQ